MNPEAEFKRAVELEAQGELRRGLDVLYALVDDFYRRDAWLELNEWLAEVDVDCMGSSLCVGLLCVTAREKEALPNRAALYTRVKGRLAVLAPTRLDRLVAGLE